MIRKGKDETVLRSVLIVEKLHFMLREYKKYALKKSPSSLRKYLESALNVCGACE
jgi:hypothetical protein